MAGSSAGSNVKNQLATSKSPYLLQHATNPVHWYPWGAEALNKAKEENKIIFLSVGYSTCHWCHVMEKESFENDDIADVMNTHFINIKVDREERPDIDKVYMTYVQATTGSGGWPMSVWLTPDLKPIYGGTYFPPSDEFHNRPGFKSVLIAIAKQWEEEKDKIMKTGTIITDMLQRETAHRALGDQIPSSTYIHKAYQQLYDVYDSKFGGFGRAPKFPQPVNFTFLFNMYASKPTSSEGKRCLDMALHTLRILAKGGIHDHIGQGFHRYSTDHEWHVPHFEKMLYDQAQLADAYIDAYQITKEPLFKEVACDILLYVSRDLSDKSGGFYSAEDADSLPTLDAKHKKEGAFCVWTKSEVIKLLDQPIKGKPSVKLHELICDYYNVKDDGNVNPAQDPHQELKHQNVFIVKQSLEDVALKFGINLKTLEDSLKKAQNILSEARASRPKPHLDDKMIAAWNGLMIAAFAKAGQVFEDESYVARAVTAANFVENYLYDQVGQKLLRSCYRDSEKSEVVKSSPLIYGFVDDYSFVIRGLIAVYEATGDIKWLQLALNLQERQNELFWDSQEGAYFLTDGQDSSVLFRLKDDQDGAQPSANSVSILNLLKFAEMFAGSTGNKDKEMREKAEAILKVFGVQMKSIPLSLVLMLCGLQYFNFKWKRIVITGSKEDDKTKAFLRGVNSVYIPNKVLILVDSSSNDPLYEAMGVTIQLKASKSKPTVFLCEGQTCALPITDPNTLEKELKY